MTKKSRNLKQKLVSTYIILRLNIKFHQMQTYLTLSFLYVCMVNTIYLLSFVETPRKFIIAELSIRKLGSSSVLIIRLFEFTRPFLYIKCRDCMLA